jgi:hypothetical protein
MGDAKIKRDSGCQMNESKVKIPKKDYVFLNKYMKEKGELLFNGPSGFAEFWDKVPKRGYVLKSVSDLKKWSLRVWIECLNNSRKESEIHGRRTY